MAQTQLQRADTENACRDTCTDKSRQVQDGCRGHIHAETSTVAGTGMHTMCTSNPSHSAFMSMAQFFGALSVFCAEAAVEAEGDTGTEAGTNTNTGHRDRACLHI